MEKVRKVEKSTTPRAAANIIQNPLEIVQGIDLDWPYCTLLPRKENSTWKKGDYSREWKEKRKGKRRYQKMPPSANPCQIQRNNTKGQRNKRGGGSQEK